ncbi:MAG: prolyl oligopeptidase family serine peptidase, partial [Alphaproteobacteria bacterium]|nr:prolyl oligopeptidase family serine peptidase [Alphaproteobacteria bacterium]
VKVTGPKESSSIYGYDPQRNTVRRVRDSQAPGDLQNCIVETLHAPSPDGTMVPIQLIRHPDTKRDGTAALMLHVYGGFNEIETLGYSSFMAQWVRMGGIYAVAQVRGGGEMGRDWYDQGRLLKKQNTFDDLAACARHLIDKKYTSAARLVSEGGSNGGMVTLATMLQKPRLFGAVLADVPVTDMMRYQHFTAGKGWRSDYGDPETKRADFQATMGYSPLHNVRRGAVYPPCLVMTGDHDDRVVPSHAYKFVAALQQHAHRDNIALLRVGQDTGHGAGKPLALEIAEYADIFAFVTRSIGPINQAEFKAARTVRQSPAPGAKPATWS